MSETFDVTLTFNSEEVWEAVTGSGFAHTKYWVNFVELETWRRPCAITITHDTAEGGESVTTIEPARLFEAFGELVKAKLRTLWGLQPCRPRKCRRLPR
jgi:hypothetical protein